MTATRAIRALRRRAYPANLASTQLLHTMATATAIQLDTAHRPVFGVPVIPQATATRTSELLQQNHRDHHMFFNDMGFHNHIVHHHLALYALAASEEQLDQHFRSNASYQRPPVALHEQVAKDMQDPAVYKKYLGQKAHFHDYLAFFQGEIEAHGVPEVLQRRLFARTELADDLLARTFGGLLHPIIHLGYGIEFAQPAIVAEALAQAAVHEDWMHPILLETEKLASKASKPAGTPTFLALIHRAADDAELAHAVQSADPGELRRSLLQQHGERFFQVASEYTVSPETLQEQTVEMLATAAYMTVTAQRPDTHAPKLDFFLVHSLNCGIFFPRFAETEWIRPEDKCRLLEFKVWMDLANYLARGTPKLEQRLLDEYQPKHGGESWEDVFARVKADQADDGHAVKAIRALAACEALSGDSITLGAGAGHDEVVVARRHWLLLAQLAMDSFEASGPRFVRGAGVDEAWAAIPRRSQAKV